MQVQANTDIFFCPLFYRKESRLYVLFCTENSFKRTNRIMVPLCSKFSYVSTWAPWAGQLFMTGDCHSAGYVSLLPYPNSINNPRHCDNTKFCPVSTPT